MQLSKIHIGLGLGLLLLTSSCTGDQMERLLEPFVQAPGSTIERQVKGHEQIASVQAILRLSVRRANGYGYLSYGLSNYVEPAVPIYQQIDISKDDMGRISITSARKAFDVVKSKHYIYSLELRYYDLNGKFINHQFSYYDKNNLEESTLQHHQHFFTLQNYALYGQQLVYPMTLDSVYIDEFTFPKLNGKRQESGDVSLHNVYVPVGEGKGEHVRYDAQLAQRAIEKSGTKEAKATYTDPATGQQYRLYKTYNPTAMDHLTRDIFEYTYRDTDPVEEPIYSEVRGVDDLGRNRIGKPTQLLQQNRDLTTWAQQDYLGFKGILQFKRSNVAFQMRVCIAHMLTATEKYVSPSGRRGILHEHHEISPSWSSFDIDYPLAFRVIADADGDPVKFATDVQRYYPQAQASTLQKMFESGSEWYRYVPRIIM